MLDLSASQFVIPILVHEYSTESCIIEAVPLATASRQNSLYRIRIPPDQLNPNGWFDGALQVKYSGSNNRKKKTGRIDLRAGSLPMPLPSRGMALEKKQ